MEPRILLCIVKTRCENHPGFQSYFTDHISVSLNSWLPWNPIKQGRWSRKEIVLINWFKYNTLLNLRFDITI